MAEAEFEAIWAQVQADTAREGPAEEDAGKSEDEVKAEYRKIADRRVRLGLVLAEIGREQNVSITDQELLQAAREEAMRYPGQEQQVFDALRQNPDAQARLRAPVYEDKVVDAILSLAKVTDETVSKEALLAEDELPEGYGGEGGAKAKSSKAKPKAEAKPKAKPRLKPSRRRPSPRPKPSRRPKPSPRPRPRRPRRRRPRPPTDGSPRRRRRGRTKAPQRTPCNNSGARRYEVGTGLGPIPSSSREPAPCTTTAPPP